jgi:glycosyltransferase involved in cell wall biosynthesis
MYRNETVSIVLPAYNEADGIEHAVADFLSVDVVDEVVVVNNNSRDATPDLARTAGARVVDETRQGYGSALRRGLAEATTDIVIMAEPDGTFIADDVHKLLAYSQDADMVLGTRTTPELIFSEANMGMAMRWGNWIVAKLLQILFNTPSLSDCGCTMRLIRRSALERFRDRLTVDRSHFLPEMVILARQSGVSIIEVPVTYRGRRGISKITGSWRGTVEVGVRMLQLILTYRLTGRAPAQR